MCTLPGTSSRNCPEYPQCLLPVSESLMPSRNLWYGRRPARPARCPSSWPAHGFWVYNRMQMVGGPGGNRMQSAAYSGPFRPACGVLAGGSDRLGRREQTRTSERSKVPVCSSAPWPQQTADLPDGAGRQGRQALSRTLRHLHGEMKRWPRRRSPHLAVQGVAGLHGGYGAPGRRPRTTRRASEACTCRDGCLPTLHATR